MGKVRVHMLWGTSRARFFERWGGEEPTEENLLTFLKEYPDCDPQVCTYEFETEAEACAFLLGVQEQDGWGDQYCVTSPDEVALLRKLCAIYNKYHSGCGSMSADVPR